MNDSREHHRELAEHLLDIVGDDEVGTVRKLIYVLAALVHATLAGAPDPKHHTRTVELGDTL